MRHGTNEDQGGTTYIRLRVLAARRARASAGFAAVIFLTVISGCLYQFQFSDNPYGVQVIVLMGLVGLVLVALGRRATTKRMTELAILRFYKSFRFYGTVISVSAALVFTYALIIKPETKVRARVVPAAAPTPIPEAAPVVETPPEFPKLVLTGVSLIGRHSSAIINAETVYEGETIAGVRLVKVMENDVVVELNGYTKRISRFTPPPKNSSKSSSR